MDTKTKEDLRKAAVQAVAQRIAAEHAAKKNAAPAPPPSIFKPKAPAEPVDVPLRQRAHYCQPDCSSDLRHAKG